jgi:peptide/nickel transport system substrate-binding protein
VPGGANKTGSAATSSSSTAAASGQTSTAAAANGGTLSVAIQTPAAAIDPLTISDPGGLCLIGQVGEFLAFDNNVALQLQPQLATSWKASDAGKTWTFTLRQGVTFHDGSALTADDVVYTFQQLSDTKNASNALSNLGGVLTPAGVRKVDDHTVAFHLEAANGNFPYLVSSDNYNAIILPKGRSVNLAKASVSA